MSVPGTAAELLALVRSSGLLDAGLIDDEAQVVHVLAGALAPEQIDHEVVVDAHRRKRHITCSPLGDPFGREPEQIGVPGERSLGVGDVHLAAVGAQEIPLGHQFRLGHSPACDVPLEASVERVEAGGVGVPRPLYHVGRADARVVNSMMRRQRYANTHGALVLPGG